MKKIKFKVITLFPELVTAYLKDALIAKAIAQEIISVDVVDLRKFSQNKYNSVDDTVFGGGEGMLIQYQPLYLALNEASATRGTPHQKIIYLSPQGQKWNHNLARKWTEEKEIILICGRYAGIDQRFIHQHVDQEVSIGDYVLSGGELPALILIESMSRFLPGVLGNPQSAALDTFEDGLLEAPQFTKSQIENGISVPAVLLSGNHQKISQWRKMVSILVTLKKRPDLLATNKTIDWSAVHQFYQTMELSEKQVLDIVNLEFDHV